MVEAAVTISKGAKTVTIYPIERNHNLKNKLFVITPPTSPNSQDEGPKTPKIIDLLRITQTFRVKGRIISATKSNAYSQKNDLIEICEGADVQGGVCTLVFEPDNPVSARGTIEGFIENFIVTERAGDLDSSLTYPDDTIWFEVDLSLVLGESV